MHQPVCVVSEGALRQVTVSMHRMSVVTICFAFVLLSVVALGWIVLRVMRLPIGVARNCLCQSYDCHRNNLPSIAIVILPVAISDLSHYRLDQVGAGFMWRVSCLVSFYSSSLGVYLARCVTRTIGSSVSPASFT